jgi:ATPase subunit of ABC transporter with duplicated ATPase domains
VGCLPQAITLGARRTVSGLVGITAARTALHAIEAGETSEDAFAAAEDDWDVEERAVAWLDRLGLAHLGLDDQVQRLSGGETIGVALAALFLRGPGIMLLDEPTNNLDMASVRQLSQALDGYRGAILVASHDVPFLRSAGISR